MLEKSQALSISDYLAPRRIVRFDAKVLDLQNMGEDMCLGNKLSDCRLQALA